MTSHRSRKIRVLFGPPGSGKSTIVRACQGLDLEDYDNEDAIRALIPSLTALDPRTIIGAANLQPFDFGEIFFTRILLLPERTAYDHRRAVRDTAQPSKRNQGDYYDAFARATSQFDAVWTSPLDYDQDIVDALNRHQPFLSNSTITKGSTYD